MSRKQLATGLVISEMAHTLERRIIAQVLPHRTLNERRRTRIGDLRKLQSLDIEGTQKWYKFVSANNWHHDQSRTLKESKYRRFSTLSELHRLKYYSYIDILCTINDHYKYVPESRAYYKEDTLKLLKILQKITPEGKPLIE